MTTLATNNNGSTRRAYLVEIFLVSFASLLLEISYTRIVSFKLFYYYTYLVIGLALLGIGSGGVLVATSKRLARATTDAILMWSALAGAAAIGLGYLLVAWIPIDTLAIWDYGTRASFKNVAAIVGICLVLFAPFLAVGVVISTLFSRRPENIGRLYFFDLLGAGIACAIVVSLLGWIGPPATILLAGVMLAITGLRIAWRDHPPPLRALAGGLAGLLLVGVIGPSLLPDQRTDATKVDQRVFDTLFSSWSPLFRVDVIKESDRIRILFHDGLLGTPVQRFDGDVSTLTRFENNDRSIPYSPMAQKPSDMLIIGAGGGTEILSALHYDVDHIDAVELNPVTYDLITEDYAKYSGNIANNDQVNYVKDEGRSYLARGDKKYDLIWTASTDSYSAANAATSGAFVLSESYLYTSEAIEESLSHLRRGGILAAQFGEFDYETKPNRTARYVSTARKALADLGVKDPRRHILVATSPLGVSNVALVTILTKETPFSTSEVKRFTTHLKSVERGGTLRYAPGGDHPISPVSEAITTPDGQLDVFFDSYPYDVRAISDNRPFFWHFSPFDDVIGNFDQPIDREDFEVAIGERVLLLLLLVAVVLAAVFLLLPFLAIRETWKKLPKKRMSALYFAALGFGFIFYEITLIQRLTLLLGYPTYSLTVTLMSILIFTGVGALLTGRYDHLRNRAAPVLLGLLALLTIFYLFALPPLADELLSSGLAIRIVFSFLVLAPLGLCLGAFMPLGLGAIATFTDHPREYVAWGWAVNGFASVIGSVLTTVLAMTFGFNVVLVTALAIYCVAVATLRVLLRHGQGP